MKIVYDKAALENPETPKKEIKEKIKLELKKEIGLIVIFL